MSKWERHGQHRHRLLPGHSRSETHIERPSKSFSESLEDQTNLVRLWYICIPTGNIHSSGRDQIWDGIPRYLRVMTRHQLSRLLLLEETIVGDCAYLDVMIAHHGRFVCILW